MNDCDTGAFGYIEVEDDKLKVVYGDPSKPSIMRFCSTEYVNAIKEYQKLKVEVEKWKHDFIKLREELNIERENHYNISDEFYKFLKNNPMFPFMGTPIDSKPKES